MIPFYFVRHFLWAVPFIQIPWKRFLGVFHLNTYYISCRETIWDIDRDRSRYALRVILKIRASKVSVLMTYHTKEGINVSPRVQYTQDNNPDLPFFHYKKPTQWVSASFEEILRGCLLFSRDIFRREAIVTTVRRRRNWHNRTEQYHVVW